jgi:succinate-semialdehyde dehydrogenase/glutarate-semialdehyde dehydrogenase
MDNRGFKSDELLLKAVVHARTSHEPSAPLALRIINPATAETLAELPCLEASLLTKVIDRTEAAFRTWSAESVSSRASKLRSIASLLRRRRAEVSEIITREQGKPIRESGAEVEYSASYFDWFAEEGRRAYGRIIPSPHTSVRHQLMVLKEPVGIAAAITPWNFPLAMVARKMAPALAAGCSFIVKPAPETPLSALLLSLLAEEAELPPGLVHVVNGDASRLAQALFADPRIRKLSFTGSTSVGRLLMHGASTHLTRLTLELGGNAPFIVFDDADIDAAADGAIYAKYRNAGQTCICVNRFLVHQRVVEEFHEALAQRTRKLRVGNGLDPETDIGPLISSEAVTRVRDFILTALSQGATLSLGEVPDPASRYVYPVMLTDIRNEMEICQHEVFGPVATIQTFSHDDECVSLANQSVAGLAAYVYSKDLSRSLRIMRRLEYGMVGINTSVLSFVEAPFGGIKASGFGREGGSEGLDEYLNLKFVAMEG